MSDQPSHVGVDADDPPHVGVNADDPRNAGPIAFFRPKPVDRAALREKVARLYSGPQREARLAEHDRRMAVAQDKPTSPLGQRLDTHPDPYYGLGVHPDIIDIMWAIDSALPRSSRYVFWGGPALVHPTTGVVFCVGLGAIGFAMRLPPGLRASAPEALANTLDHIGGPNRERYDISGAGPEWRFIAYDAPREQWGLAAFEFAGEPAAGVNARG